MRQQEMYGSRKYFRAPRLDIPTRIGFMDRTWDACWLAFDIDVQVLGGWPHARHAPTPVHNPMSYPSAFVTKLSWYYGCTLPGASSMTACVRGLVSMTT